MAKFQPEFPCCLAATVHYTPTEFSAIVCCFQIVPGYRSRFHPIDKDLSMGAPAFHPIDKDLSMGAPVFHPSDKDLSMGTPGVGRVNPR